MRFLLIFALCFYLLVSISGISKLSKVSTGVSKAGNIASRFRGGTRLIQNSRLLKAFDNLKLRKAEVAVCLETSSNGEINLFYYADDIADLPENILPESLDLNHLSRTVRTIESYNKTVRILVFEDLYSQYKYQLSELKNYSIRIQIVTKREYRILDGYFIQSNGEDVLVAQIQPGIVAEVNPTIPLDETILILRQPTNRTDLKIISLLDTDDLPVINSHTLEEIAKKNNISYNSADDLNNNNLWKIFEESKNKNVIVVGHVEGAAFVIRNSKNQITASFEIAKLEEYAGRQNVGLILLGCRTSRVSNVAGLNFDTNLDLVANKLVEAIDQTNYQNMLSTLGARDNPLIIRSSTVDELRRIREFKIEQDQKAGDTLVKTAVMAGRTKLLLPIVALPHREEEEEAAELSVSFKTLLILISIMVMIIAPLGAALNFILFREPAWNEFIRMYSLVPPGFKPNWQSPLSKPFKFLLFLPYLQFYVLRRTLIYLMVFSSIAMFALVFYSLCLNVFIKFDWNSLQLEEFLNIDKSMWTALEEFVMKFQKT